jgi:predicted TIM-barrel fold metal-dependent hydrolase
VAVVGADAGTDELNAMHRAGVRGLRVNLHTSGAGDGGADTATERLTTAGAQAAAMGWHVQVFASPTTLLGAADAIADMPVPVVVDHFGLVSGPGRELDGLCDLLRAGHVGVKLSAPERAVADPDGAAMAAVAHALLAAAPDRTVWASDWPHTDARNRIDPLAVQPFRAVDDHASLRRLWRWCGGEQAWRAVLATNPARLYG